MQRQDDADKLLQFLPLLFLFFQHLQHSWDGQCLLDKGRNCWAFSPEAKLALEGEAKLEDGGMLLLLL